MKNARRRLVIVCGLLWAGAALAETRELSFEQRIRCHEQVEAVYRNHRNPAAASFRDEVTADAAVRKAEDAQYLSAALAELWQRPLAPQQLQAEVDRMARHSRSPAVLRELFLALDDDPYLVAECLARPVLAARLARSWYAGDGRFRDEMAGADSRSGPERPFDVWWSEARLSFAGRAEPRPAAFDFVLPAVVADGCPADTWAPTAGDMPDPRDYPRAVWTGAEMIVWGGQILPVAVGSGGRYDPATDTWTPTSTTGAPAGRYLHTAVWTGTRMVVWGGITKNEFTNTGARYDPATDTWTPTSIGPGVPTPRSSHTAVWTGSEMIVWGGGDSAAAMGTGARYNPASNSWTPLPATALAARYDHTAVWTGTAMIVWGGQAYPTEYDTGARYEPGANTWTLLPTGGAPAARTNHTAVWTGTDMIIWGGNDGSSGFLASGARYRPSTNAWLSTATAGAPGGRWDHSAVWAPEQGAMIVWGGLVGIGLRGNTGGRYLPASNTWLPVATTAGVPQRRMRHSAVWTGTEMIVWGGDDYGFDGFIYLQSGGRYAPATNSWVAIASGATTPEARRYHSTVWTGAEMIVWGGFGSQLLGTGGRYDPALDDWTPTATSGAPAARIFHSAVWTGDKMIVWGGSNPFAPQATGSRYAPALDQWTATATGGAPAARAQHSAIWTGREMIVAGGSDQVGRYTEATNSWVTSGAPTAVAADRTGHAAVWTGSEMILWGGRTSEAAFAGDGGRFDPRHDSWQFLRGPVGATPTQNGSTVWTGSELIVWGGGSPAGFVGTGARFDPATDSWTAISTGSGVPSPRQYAGAVWTGDEMIVWGGQSPYPSVHLADGSRYDAALDQWTPVSDDGAPQARSRHGAVFTDLPDPRMIVWGGLPNASSGGAYCAPCTPRTWYRDADADDHGDAGPTVEACTRPPGYAPVADDCADGDPDRFPGNPELCGDLKDNDCNLIVDDVSPPGRVSELFPTPSGAAGIALTWSYAAAAQSYDVTRGSVAALVASGGDFALAADACIAENTPTRSASDATLPPPGGAFWYVVRGVNCAGNGSYDTASPSQQGSRDPGLDAPGPACD